MLGSGFIARFYADSLQGYRNKDKITSVYSRKEESAKKFADDYKVANHTTNMKRQLLIRMLILFVSRCQIICMKKQ